MTLLRFLVACAAMIGGAALTLAQSAQTPPAESPRLAGYSSQSSPSERDWEKKFQAGIVPDNLRQNMQRLSARPHHVGSPYDRDNADWILSKFKEWGFDAHIETFQVLFPTPKERIVEMIEPARFRAKLQEPVVAGDPTSNQTAEQLPTYNAYSIDGDVTAPLVYVNYGNREDYEQLDRLGISVKGAIVIARYGEGWRGIKPKVAAEHQAIGCIIYSDPKDDGFFNGDDYPKGGWRPREGVQRDLLPLVEGSTVSTKYGVIKTDHILFIASGAFHLTKPSDLIPELQGRFPIRVELSALSADDFVRILTEPNASLTEQYTALLATEGVTLSFSADGIKRIAEMGWQVNEKTENIGARRLHTILERLLEEISYNAPDLMEKTIVIDAAYVDQHLAEFVEDEDLSRYIL